jgi:lipopolysaccharide export system protein LptC
MVRHSRFVRFLRFAIPVGIVAIIAIMVSATFFSPSRLFPGFPIDPGKVSLSGTKVVMELPRVGGFTGDSQPYEVTARTATQDLTKPDILELRDISALVKLKDGQHVTIKSINGVYNTKGDVLTLNDHITLNSTSGYEAYLSEATVNTVNGNIVSESPVEVKLPNDGLIKANRLEVKENGALILFGGGVETTVKPQDSAPVGAPAQVSAQPPPPVPGQSDGKTRQSSGSRQRAKRTVAASRPAE